MGRNELSNIKNEYNIRDKWEKKNIYNKNVILMKKEKIIENTNKKSRHRKIYRSSQLFME